MSIIHRKMMGIAGDLRISDSGVGHKREIIARLKGGFDRYDPFTNVWWPGELEASVRYEAAEKRWSWRVEHLGRDEVRFGSGYADTLREAAIDAAVALARVQAGEEIDDVESQPRYIVTRWL